MDYFGIKAEGNGAGFSGKRPEESEQLQLSDNKNKKKKTLNAPGQTDEMYLIYIYPSIHFFPFILKINTTIQIGKKPVPSGMHYIKFILQFIDMSGGDK